MNPAPPVTRITKETLPSKAANARLGSDYVIRGRSACLRAGPPRNWPHHGFHLLLPYPQPAPKIHERRPREQDETTMAQWTAFPRPGHYRHDAASVTREWSRLHCGDAEPLPADAAVLAAWVLYHNGEFSQAVEAGLA